MAQNGTVVPRDIIEFDPFAKDLVEAFATLSARHRPDEEIVFFDCGNCDTLHVFVGENSGAMLNISRDSWKRRARQ